ncbi:BlaI/MecI/CopY family transcriptional regulator [Brevundimonas sp.]|uniref:BlaI/MecI/CopY family transcriptional regulator n=1 Tax=Brevundimonas sp. TaxID=1871086 RepID=UPI0035B0A3B5
MTEAESVVMAALWRRGPLSFADLIDEVRRGSAWGDATIKTLLNRLMKKGAVRSVKAEGRQRYHPALSRDAYVTAEVDALLARLFGGDPAALAEHLRARATPA